MGKGVACQMFLIRVNFPFNISFLCIFILPFIPLSALTLQVKIPDSLLLVPLSFLSSPEFFSHQAKIPILSMQNTVFCQLSGYSNHMVRSILFWVGSLVRFWVVACSFQKTAFSSMNIFESTKQTVMHTKAT